MLMVYDFRGGATRDGVLGLPHAVPKARLCDITASPLRPTSQIRCSCCQWPLNRPKYSSDR